jgi:transcriptional regulator with XRE-family HTH domain
MNYGRAIRIARTANGMTQGELADRLSVGASHLSLIESGKRQPSLRLLREISAALEVPLHLLTLLASDSSEFEDPKNAAQMSEIALRLLRLLASSGDQRTLPLKNQGRTKKLKNQVHTKKRRSA